MPNYFNDTRILSWYGRYTCTIVSSIERECEDTQVLANVAHDLMIVVRVDQSINQYDNYIMTLHYDRVNYSGLCRWPSSSKTGVKTNVKTDVKSNPVVETQYITIDLYKRS